MKKNVLYLLLFCSVMIFMAGCAEMRGPHDIDNPEHDNTVNARGSYVWWTNREDDEEAGQEDNGQFGDQGFNQNDEGNSAINIDSSFPGVDDISTGGSSTATSNKNSLNPDIGTITKVK